VLGLQAENAENIGVAVLREEGDRTAVTLYLLNPDQIGQAKPATLAAPEETLTIEIVDAWVFQPSSLEVPRGATVTWVNNSDAAHTVTGDDLTFDDSADRPGDSFRQTFDEPNLSLQVRAAPRDDRVIVAVERWPDVSRSDVGLRTIAQITDNSTSRLSQPRRDIRCRKASTRGSFAPAVRATSPSSAPARPRPTTPRRTKRTNPTSPQTIQRSVNGIPNWPAIHTPAIKRMPIASKNRPPKHFALLPQGGGCRWLTRARDSGIEHRQGQKAPDRDDGRRHMQKLQPEVKRVH
jgi:plastocyanin